MYMITNVARNPVNQDLMTCISSILNREIGQITLQYLGFTVTDAMSKGQSKPVSLMY